MLKVVIDRKRWLRGGGVEGDTLDSCLLNKSGKMCCLGFAARAARVRKKDILGVASPAGLFQTLGKLPRSLMRLLGSGSKDHYNSDLCGELMEANDSLVNDSYREARIEKLGLKVGLEFSFKD